jgi:PPOX class probable F420-dependent enzyme
VRLAPTRCWELLRSAEHASLSTLNAEETIDAVPVCFAVVEQLIVSPIDDVKPKETTNLGRVRNLKRRPAATLLCDHWDPDDWTQLWWVRARLQVVPTEMVTVDVDLLERALRDKYLQYANIEFADLLVFTVVDLIGWSAQSD